MRHARWAMGAIGMGFDAALVTAGVCVGAALAAGSMAAGDEQRGGADEQGEEFDVFHVLFLFWFAPAGST